MADQDVTEYLSGMVERITYHNSDNGFWGSLREGTDFLGIGV
jgi:hypothetical protein